MRTGPQRPVRILSSFGGGLAAIALAAAVPFSPADAQGTLPIAAAAAANGVSDFYKARDGRSLWFSQTGRQADVLLEILGSAELDGLGPDRYRVEDLKRAVQAASESGSSRAMRRADKLLSQALVDYVRDVRTPPRTDTIYVDSDLKPSPPSARAILDAAAKAPSLETYVAEMRWMNPLYAQLIQERVGNDRI